MILERWQSCPASIKKKSIIYHKLYCVSLNYYYDWGFKGCFHHTNILKVLIAVNRLKRQYNCQSTSCLRVIEDVGRLCLLLCSLQSPRQKNISFIFKTSQGVLNISLNRDELILIVFYFNFRQISLWLLISWNYLMWSWELVHMLLHREQHSSPKWLPLYTAAFDLILSNSCIVCIVPFFIINIFVGL